MDKEQREALELTQEDLLAKLDRGHPANLVGPLGKIVKNPYSSYTGCEAWCCKCGSAQGLRLRQDGQFECSDNCVRAMQRYGER